jgi:hypothetical protein
MDAYPEGSPVKEMDTVEHDMPKSKVAWVNVIASRCRRHPPGRIGE